MAVVLLVGCQAATPDPQSGTDAGNGRPTVLATNPILTAIAGRLAGQAIELRYLPPTTVDTAHWHPADADLAALQAADLILLQGAGHDAWRFTASLPADRCLIATAGFEDRLIARPGVRHQHGPDGAHDHGTTAWTTWLDPDLLGQQASRIAQALKRLLPTEEAAIDERASLLADQIATWNEDLQELFAVIRGEALIVSHPVYDYLERAYHLDCHALEWEPDTPPDAEALAALRQLVADSGATWFVWEAEPVAAAEAAVAGTGLQTLVFTTAATPPAAGDALDVLFANVERLRRALDR